jgi:hypothetical protein
MREAIGSDGNKNRGAEEGILSAHFSQVTAKPALAR